MTRGSLYRVRKPHSREPKRSRVFVVVSRQQLIDSVFSTVICAPVYSAYHGLTTQVLVGTEHGLRHVSSIHCDELMSLPKARLTDYIGQLDDASLQKLDRALTVALGLSQ